MGRPTNKERLKRKMLLKYFKRDSDIYTTFEEMTKEKNKRRTLGLFVDQSSFRATCNKLNRICCHTEGKELFFKELDDLDKSIHDYYCSLLANTSFSNITNGHYLGLDIFNKEIIVGQQNSHNTIPIIDEARLIEIFGEEKVKELGGNGYPHYLTHLNFKLTLDEKKLLIKNINKDAMGTRTIIEKETGNYGSCLTDYNNNSFLVEVDFTQPLKDIQNHIEHLYKERQQKRVLNIFDYLNIERTPVNQNEIYKTNSHKPFNVVLADKLFVYDAKKNGLNIKDICEEIDRYTNKVKKISTDEINENTVRKYLKTMTGFIDNHGYLGFKNGYVFE